MSETSSPQPRDLIDSDKTLRERLLLLWDLAIIVLVSVNLVLIIFDALFAVEPLAAGFDLLWPAGHDWYQHAIHRNFATIDLVFVAVFVADVLAGWALAITERRYYRWFFYPFVHWYDVLGCVPVAGFRFLRVLRVISIGMRLQRLGVIDVRCWAVYRSLMVYYGIVVEEVSDRVVIKMLSGVQDELRSDGQQMTRRIITDVVQPRRQRLVRSATAQIENAITEAYRANREQLQGYVARVVNRGVDRNPALKRLERVPMLGRFVSQALDQAITDTVNDVLDEAVAGLSSEALDALIEDIADSVISRLLAADVAEASEIRDAVIEVLELIKAEVAIQHWREQFEKGGSRES